MRYAVALSLALTVHAHAVEVPYDFDRDIKQQRIEELYVRTRSCMVEAGTAILRLGLRDEDNVLLFMVRTCANPMLAQVQADGKMNDQEAREWLIRLAHTTLYEDILRKPEPKLN